MTPATCVHCGQPVVPCFGAALPACKGWVHAGMDDRPIGRHYCEGRSVNPSAEPEQPVLASRVT